MLASVALLLFSFFIAKFLRVEMMAEDDQGPDIHYRGSKAGYDH